MRCLYFAEDEAVAKDEYRRYWRGLPAEHQPKLTFTAEVRLGKVIDLADAAVMSALGLAGADLRDEWRGQPTTRLQALGEAVSRQRAVAAIRYPSQTRSSRDTAGWNVAIFPETLNPPDRVDILGDAPKPLETIP